MIAQAFIVFCTLSLLLVVCAKYGAKFAGLLSGLPTGSAITIFLLGLNFNPGFAATSASYNIKAVPAILVLLGTYYFTLSSNIGYKKIIAPLSAAFSFLVSAIIVKSTDLSWQFYFGIAFVFIIFGLQFGNESGEEESDDGKSSSIDIATILLRSFFASSFIIVLISFSRFFGPEISGLASAFPSTLFPLLCIVHWFHGESAAQQVIRYSLIGLLGLLFYMWTVHMTYAEVGLIPGTVLAYLAVVGVVFVQWLGSKSSSTLRFMVRQ